MLCYARLQFYYAHSENNFVFNPGLQPSLSNKMSGVFGACAPPSHLMPSVTPSGEGVILYIIVFTF